MNNACRKNVARRRIEGTERKNEVTTRCYYVEASTKLAEKSGDMQKTLPPYKKLDTSKRHARDGLQSMQ